MNEQIKKKLRGGTGRVNLFRNGMASETSTKSINNRTWVWFRFSCKDLGADGKLASPARKADFLFDYEREGTLHEVSGSDIELFYEIEGDAPF